MKLERCSSKRKERERGEKKKKRPPRNRKKMKMESIKAAVSLAETGVTQAVAQIGRLGNRSAVAQAAVCAPPPPARPCTNAHI